MFPKESVYQTIREDCTKERGFSGAVCLAKLEAGPGFFNESSEFCCRLMLPDMGGKDDAVRDRNDVGWKLRLDKRLGLQKLSDENYEKFMQLN